MINKILELLSNKNAYNKNQVVENLLFNKNTNRYVIGRNETTLSLSKIIKVDGIIDDFVQEKTWKNIPVLHPDKKISPNSIIINCSSSIAPVSSHRKLSKKFNCDLIGYFELVNSYPYIFPFPKFCLEMQKDFFKNKNKWHNLYYSMADDKSRRTLEDLLCYRLSGNYNFMSDYSIEPQKQYFEDFMEYSQEIFVDIGGFDGDTTEEFIKQDPKYKHIYFFEPSKANMIKAKNKLKDLSDISFMEYGLSDVEKVVSFNSNCGSSSVISRSGSDSIKVKSLDKLIQNKVTFIKMDIEGWERKAILGSRNTIKKFLPKLAIAVYHKSSDFWKIAEIVTKISSGYDIYLRHYTEGWSETVMYFKPR